MFYGLEIHLETLFQLSGREMFYFNPDLAANDLMEEGDEAFESYAREEEEEEEGVEYKNIEIDALEAAASEADGNGTICPQNRFAGVVPLPNGSSEKPSEAESQKILNTFTHYRICFWIQSPINHLLTP